MAASNLGSLTIDLILRTVGLTQGADKAERELSRRTKSMQDSARKAGVAIGSALAVGIGTATAAIIASTKSAIDFADSIRDMSIRTGLSTETLSGFSYAAKQTGTDIEALGKSFNILSKNATAALDPKSRQAGLFKALLGDDYTKDLTDLEKLIPRIADAFSNLEDGPTKAAIALQLLGRAGAESIEFYNSGAAGLDEFTQRARELGIELSQGTTDAADEFNDKLEDLKAAFAGLGIQVAEDLLPKLIDLVDVVSEFASEGGNAEAIADAIAGSFEFAARAGVGLYEVFRQIKLRMNDIVLAAGEMSPGAGIRSLFEGGDYSKPYEDLRKQRLEIAGQLEESNKRLAGAVNGSTGKEERPTFTLPGVSVQGTKKQIDEAEKQAKRLAGFLNNPTGRKSGGGSKKSGKSDAEREAEQLTRAYESMNERLDEQKALFGETGEAARVRYEVESGALKGLDQAQKDLLVTKAAQLDQMELEKELSEAAKDRIEEETKAFETQQEHVEQFIEDLKFENEMIGLSNEAREIAIAQRYANVEAMSAEGQEISELIKKNIELAEAAQFLDDTQSALSDSFADFITGAKSAKEAFGDFADDLFKRAAQFVADQAIKKLFDSFSGNASASGSGGNGWADLIGAFFGGGKASGGTALPRMMYEVNERGFEMATVRGRDYMMTGSNPVEITPSHRLGGGGMTVNNVNNYREPYSERTENQKLAKLQYLTGVAASRNR